MNKRNRSACPKPRRRLLQYRLRTMLLLITVVGIWLGVQTNRAVMQRDAVAALQELGAEITYDWQLEGSGSASSKPPGPAFLRRIVGVDFLATVEKVSFLPCERICDADLEHLQDLTNVTTVLLTGDLTDEGLRSLASVPQLKWICLVATNTTANGVSDLEEAMPGAEIVDFDSQLK